MTFLEAFEALVRHLQGIAPTTSREETMDWLVFDWLLPRGIACVLVGIILAVGGAVMQSAIGNPLADSYTTGISSGALFGVTVAIILNFTLIPGNPEIGKVFNAFVFSLVPTAVIILFCYKRSTPMKMILVGIGVMYIFSAATTLLRYTATSEKVAEIYEWSVGTMTHAQSWEPIPFLIIATVIIMVTMMFLSRKINVLTSGDEMSIALGVNASRTRILLLTIVALCTSMAVCFTGSIGFVGLIIPHIARMFVGSNSKYLIPLSAVLGAMMLIVSDSIARMVGTTAVPVGVVTALLGSPLFLYFLIKIRSQSW